MSEDYAGTIVNFRLSNLDGLLLSLAIGATLVVGPIAQTAERPAALSQQIADLTQEYQRAVSEFSKLYQAATTDSEREKLRSELMPDPKKFAPRFWDLAQQNSKDPAALDALIWLGTTGYQTEEAGKALSILARDHAGSEKVATVCNFAPYISSSAAGDFLRGVMESNYSGRLCYPR